MADVQADIKDWSTTASSNLPADATTLGAGLADNLQQIQATIATAFRSKGSDIASAATTDLGDTVGLYHDITGTTTITGFGTTAAAGTWKLLQFDGALQITYNATSMILPGNANITTAAGDMAMVIHEGSGNWRMLWYTKDAASNFPPFRTSNGGVAILADVSDPTKLIDFDLSGLTTATTRTLTAQDEDGTIALTSEFAYSNVAGSAGRMLYPPKHVSGLVMSQDTDADHDVAISAGSCSDTTGAVNMILSAVLTKQIDAAWSVGDDAGGLDGSESSAGTPDANTWYYVWLIKRSDTGVVDALFSESSSSPTLPTDYDYSRLIGAVLTDSSANIVDFTATETSGGGIECSWTAPPLDVNVNSTLGQSRLLSTLSVPVLPVWASFRYYIFDASAAFSFIIQSPGETDAAPSATASPLRSGTNGATSSAAQGTLRVRTSTGQIAARVDASITTADNYRIATLGWEWARR